jgi:predicted  nucleic acid-binding Zn-ribbon protein
MNASLRSATSEKEAAESRANEAATAVASKEQELRELEGEVIRLQTEVTIARAELDGAYGTRAQRAAEVAANPTIKKELDELSAKNSALVAELEALRRAHKAAASSENEARDTERTLKHELSAMTSEYEALAKDMIQNEKDRDRFEAMIDSLRDEKESLEMELSDERVRWLGVRSPGTPMAQPGAAPEATSIRMLREDFRKMMRDRTAEGLKALRVCTILVHISCEMTLTVRIGRARGTTQTRGACPYDAKRPSATEVELEQDDDCLKGCLGPHVVIYTRPTTLCFTAFSLSQCLRFAFVAL